MDNAKLNYAKIQETQATHNNVFLFFWSPSLLFEFNLFAKLLHKHTFCIISKTTQPNQYHTQFNLKLLETKRSPSITLDLSIIMLKNMISAAKDVSSSAIQSSKKAVDVTKQKLADFDESNTCRKCSKTLSTTLAV